MTSEEGKLVIRRMKAEDVDAISQIDHKLSGPRRVGAFVSLKSERFGGPLDMSIVAEVNGRVVGFIQAGLAYVDIPVTEVGIIQSIAVDPDYQRQGIATKLINTLLDNCYAGGVDTLRIAIDDRFVQLRNFFERRGFQRSHLVNYTKTFES